MSKKARAFEDVKVLQKFKRYPPKAAKHLLEIREMIFSVAFKNKDIGLLEETLKWNEPAYIAINKSGSMVRIDWKKKDPSIYRIYFHCKTILVSVFKKKYKDLFTFEGNRAIVFEVGEKIPKKELKDCIELALTYNLWKSSP